MMQPPKLLGDLESYQWSGHTPLSYAMMHDNGDLVKQLIPIFDLVNTKAFGRTPLEWAIYNNNPKMFRVLVNEPRCKLESSNKSPLRYAMEHDMPDIVPLLINDQSINKSDLSDHKTPLEWAIDNNKPEMFRTLVQNDLVSVDNIVCSKTPLRFAMENDMSDIILRLTKPGYFEAPDPSDNKSPLQWAIDNNKPEMFRLLLNCGSSLKDGDFYAKTPLRYAIEHNMTDITKSLIGQGAGINTPDQSDDKSPLQWAIDNKNGDLAIALVGAGGYIEKLISESGKSYLTYAEESNCNFIDQLRTAHELHAREVAQTEWKDYDLFSYDDNGAPVDGVHSHAEAARPNLCEAAQAGDEEMVKAILEQGSVDVNTTINGCSSLHYAIFAANVEIVGMLIKAKADISIQYQEFSPLEYAEVLKEDNKDDYVRDNALQLIIEALQEREKEIAREQQVDIVLPKASPKLPEADIASLAAASAQLQQAGAALLKESDSVNLDPRLPDPARTSAATINGRDGRAGLR